MGYARTNAELAAFHAEGNGLIFNDFTAGPAGAQNNVLHVASCRWVKTMLAGAEPTAPPSVRKVLFSAADEAQAWLAANRGQEGHGWKYCATCGGDRAKIGDRPHPGTKTDPVGTREDRTGPTIGC